VEDPGIDWRIILMDVQEVGCEGMGWTDLAEVIDRWQALVNVVMNLWVL